MHVLFMVYLVPRVLNLGAFWWWLLCLKWPPSIVLMCCLLFLNAGRLQCALWRKCVLDKLHSGMSDRASVYEVNINESTIYSLNKVFLSRNIYKTRLCIYWLTKMYPECSQGRSPVFSLEEMMQYSLIWCLRSCYKYHK